MNDRAVDVLHTNKQDIILELEHLSKRFGGIHALRDVDFTVKRGEIHGVVGENGAGKSTLMKVLSGVYSEYEGQMFLNGESVRFRSTADARVQGIGMVHQELNIFPDLTIAENIFNGTQLTSRLGAIDWPRMRTEAAKYLRELGITLDVNTLMGSVSVGMQQIIEIVRVIFSGANIIILDEPTSALSLQETQRLFSFIQRLKTQGKTILFISHFLEDVLAISDRVSIFKNGQRVATYEANNLSKQELITQMLGSDSRLLQQAYEEEAVLTRRNAAYEGEEVLALKHLSYRSAFQEVNFSVRAGEILGIYGFVGAGQEQLARCLFGILRPNKGKIQLNGKEVRFRTTTQAKRLGMAYVPENRRDSLALDQEIFKNVTLAHLATIVPFFLQRKRELIVAKEQIKATQVRPPHPFLPAGALSGGNQQKVVLAKWLVRPPKVLILAEPTRGMDVGAKEEVLELIHALRSRGVAILLISTEIETILSNCTHVIVMHRGHITDELYEEQLSKDRMLLNA